MRFRLAVTAPITFLSGPRRLCLILRLCMFCLRSGADRCSGRLRLFGSPLRALRSSSRSTCCAVASALFGLILLFGVARNGFAFALLALALLLRLLDFLGLVLDSGKVAENFCPILRQFCLSTQLHFK